MKEGSFWVPSVPNENASTLPITPKRSCSRDVGTSSYRYHTAAYSPAIVSVNRRTHDTIFVASIEKRLETDRHNHQKQPEFESQEQHGIHVTEQCDRYHELQGQRFEHLAQLRESGRDIRHAETNFDVERLVFTSRQTTSALRDIESEEIRRQGLNNDQIRTNRRNIAWRKKYNSGFNYNAQINYADASEIGPMKGCCNYSKHRGRHNEPTTNEVSVLLVNQDCDKRDIVLHRHDNRLQRISETHRSYDSLQYPLMFVYREDGYNFAVYRVNPNKGQPTFQKKKSFRTTIWLETEIRTEQIDDVIRAELPDQEVDPELFDVVKTHMVHGPCGSYNPQSPCGNTLHQYGLASPQVIDGIVENLNREYFENTNFDPVELQHMINQNEPKLNKEQNQVVLMLTLVVCIFRHSRWYWQAFFDKSFTGQNTFRKKIAIAVASSGIAATLLHGGKTAHSMLKIPLESKRMENPVCNVRKNSDKAKVLQDCVFVVWDE
ncbi:ATP-dependent DNA helicase [Trichonephila clavipes]|nr:ATP-dependent DNA helicase [Trichonephila clavipes]